jgi:tetratricopeptide (TPR) repeat protein
VLRAQGNLPGALAAYREGLDISRALTTKDASNAEWRRDLSISLESVGNVLRAQGVLPGALAAYRECLDIRRELAAKSQGNAAWQMDVVFALHNLALSGDNPRARSSEALVILKQLNSQGLLTPENQGTITIIEGELAKLAQAERQ